AGAPANANFQNTLGAALYRAGRTGDAIRELDRAVEAHPRKQGTVVDWLFLAMAHARQKDAAKARFWLAKSRSAEPPAAWQPRLELQLLLRETDEMVTRLSPE